MTRWYAPARSAALLQTCSSHGPCAPPNEATTSPPAPRMLLIVLWSTPPVSGRLASHIGLQYPFVSTNAIVNHVIPVADMMVRGSGRFPQPRYAYGLAPIGGP